VAGKVSGLPLETKMSGGPAALATFGMGLGESILLRFDDGGETRWGVIDSARKRVNGISVNPALEVLKAAGAHPSLVVLTHPHRDHAKGMADIVLRAGPDALVGCVVPLMEEEDELAAIVAEDDSVANGIGQTAVAHAAISTVWRDGRARRLNVEVEAEPFDCCGWEVTVLHPSRERAIDTGAALREGAEPNLNNVSAALTFTRGETSFLLAGDGEQEAWDDVKQRLGPGHLRDKNPLKVPHHGSVPALHAVVVDPSQPSDREQVVTPFPSSGTLPRLEPDAGVDRLVSAGGSLRLTAMPVAALPKQPDLSVAEARTALQVGVFGDDDLEIPTIALAPDESSFFEEGDRDPRECWVVLRLADDGTIDAELGSHALTIS